MKRRPHRVLGLGDAIAAADRVLSAPAYTLQRVSEDETATFATLVRQYRQLGELAADFLIGADPTPAKLVAHLVAAGFLDPLDPAPEAPHV